MNFESMTPQELEKPVNGYQMLAVVKELKGLNKTMELVAQQTQSVVTPAQLAKSETDLKKYTDKEIDDAVKEVHLTYGPMKSNLTWFTRAVVVQGVVIVAQLIIAFLIFVSLKK